MTVAMPLAIDGASAQALRQRIDDAPMSRAQIVAVAVTVALSGLDGYDILSVTFAAPAIVAAWGIGKAALGLVLAAGLLGMAVGSLALAPFADIVGRRRMVLGSLILMAAGMLLCAVSRSLPELAAARVVTGLGIGAMVALINSLAAEFSNARRRPLALALMTIGYPLGGMIGGLLAAFLLTHFGWQAVFIAGSVAACAMIPVVLCFLPEPLAFLIARRPPRALERINLLLGKYGHDPLSALPPLPTEKPRLSYAAVFSKGQRSVIAAITLVNLLYVLTVYFLLSWMPQLIADLGFPPWTASLVSAAANSAGIVGGLALGWLAQTLGLTRLTAAMMAGAGLATAILGSLDAHLPLLVAMAAVGGFFIFGGMAGLYTTLAASFAAGARTSGVGFVIGIGRCGSAVAPALAGWLYASGVDRSHVSAAFGMCAVAAAFVLLAMRTVPSPKMR